MSAVESVDELSEIINSKSSKVCPSSEFNDSFRKDSPLKTGKPMVTFGEPPSCSVLALFRLGMGFKRSTLWAALS
jgi:hypothetical protein